MECLMKRPARLLSRSKVNEDSIGPNEKCQAPITP